MSTLEIIVPDAVREFAERIGADPEAWYQNCHGASLTIVRSGLYPGARVARGWAEGIVGQHSWVSIGSPYDEESRIIDATMWSYDPTVLDIIDRERGFTHQPHGAGSIWEASPPQYGGGPIVTLKGAESLSKSARSFLSMLGDLDMQGWAQLAHSPMQGWPSAEIISAMAETPGFGALIPVDILGMLTDRNPGNLYY